MAAEMPSFIEISWRFDAFHGLFALKLIQMVGACVVYTCYINIADMGLREGSEECFTNTW